MKSIVGIIALICLVLPMENVFGQTIEDVMESSWDGTSRSRSELTESGYFYCSQYMYNVEYDASDDTFTAIMKTVFTLDGAEYISKSSVSGSVDPDDFSVVIKPEYDLYNDALPNGLYWISETIYLQLYNDGDHDGYFLLSGQSSGMNYSDELFELGNYPY
ncbi:MAG: hypothetical protein JXR53_10380 [Bacteroidales bacterium]|nr:hypothetical protein [Bacteroidales bacterium]